MAKLTVHSAKLIETDKRFLLRANFLVSCATNNLKFVIPSSKLIETDKRFLLRANYLVSCATNNLTFVIPSEAKESRFKIATPACHNTALRCAGTSGMLLAMTTPRTARAGLLKLTRGAYCEDD